MLNKDKVYLVVVSIIKNGKTNGQLFYPSYGAEYDKRQKIVGWNDGDRMRISVVKDLIEEDDTRMVFINGNGDETVFEEFNLENFETMKSQVFATDIVLKADFTTDEELQTFLMAFTS